ncbi:hypothetical protein GCM10022221_51720 [Actinocorallia aurea]
MSGGEPPAGGHRREWALALLPAVPLLLLTVRVWRISGENIDTTQLLIQNISPVAWGTALLLTLAWTLPAAVLVLRLVASLLRLSVPDAEGSALVRAGGSIPLPVAAFAALVAVLTWKLQFLPILLLVALMLVCVELRLRFPAHPRTVTAASLVLVAAVCAVFAAATREVARDALEQGDHLVLLLLALPLFALILNGPLPARAAKPVLRLVTSVFALVMSAVIVSEFLRVPLLPLTAVEIGEGDHTERVLSGYIVAIDEQVMTFLDLKGTLHFVPNDDVLSRTLCRDYARAPYTRLTFHGRNLESSLFGPPATSPRGTALDQRCYGRTTSK